ncbi:TRIC cation channel family protein [Gordonia sp. NB41Y]|uniref:trimeric intracellular cation channel family protein n=1 Tax=Gordonia sp. NB41Y TaxID=875808 RepID=UPI001C9D74CB|nr:TRIC cation channel family protein [Gordonia sp. NB41Y]WLP89145.1 TRIC cation channel family protein [Gordonia sp. NB41Y]
MATPDSGNRSQLSGRTFTAVDLVATALFGFEGAAAAAQTDLDILGILVVGFIVGLGGGILRDVLLGFLPPASLRSSSRVVAALTGATVAFVLVGLADAVPATALALCDAAALAFVAIAGAEKAFGMGCSIVVTTVIGGISATGGGIIRDVLLGRTPYVLSQSVYGTAALAGALVVAVTLTYLGRPAVALWCGFVATFGLRTLAVLLDWQVPHLT